MTGETLLQLLETRLDNVVFRLGLANSRSAARQLVSHGHVTVNGRKVNVSSYNVKPGDEIIDQGQAEIAPARPAQSRADPDRARCPDWLTVDRDSSAGRSPHPAFARRDAPIVNEQLIVELYSR